MYIFHYFLISFNIFIYYLFDLYLGNSKVFAEADLAPQQIVVGIDTDYEANKDVSIVKNNGGLTKTAQKFYNYMK